MLFINSILAFPSLIFLFKKVKAFALFEKYLMSHFVKIFHNSLKLFIEKIINS